MFRLLWSHCRNITVDVFNHKVVYNIPLYGDLMFKNSKIEINDNSITLTFHQEPIEPDSVKSLCNNLTVEKERLDETEKYSVSHQLVFREMK
jgi:hypothetical protein